MTDPRRYTITAALPYANGPVHIGHLAGCYLPADIYARYLRLAGQDVLFVCGSDEHGVAITLKARQEGLTPQKMVDKYHVMIRDAFEGFGISFDHYSRTSAPIHHQTASDFFTVLHDKGVFVKKASRQFYDAAVGQFLADRYIYGTCPNCGYEKAYGDQCEKCGTSLDPTDLKDPKSALSGQTPELRETEHWYLPLQNYEEWLKKWILEEHKDWKPNVIGQCRSWLSQGLHERSITRDMDWGVKVPLPGWEGKVLYVWLDAPIGYISATKEWAQLTGNDWQPWWTDEKTKLVHFIGKDNIVFHCIIFPSVLKAHEGYILPDNVPANEFLNIEGEKVSTSRNWAVWLHEYLVDFPGRQDTLRYVLCANAPEAKDNDFLWKDFQAKNNNELAAILGNLVNRVLVLTHKFFDGKVPPAGNPENTESLLRSQAEVYPEKIGKLIQQFRFREALQELMNFARLGNKYLTDSEPWKLAKTDMERTGTILNFSLQLSACLSILMEPFLPFSAQKLRDVLGIREFRWQDGGRFDLLKEGSAIGNPLILFSKIEDNEIERQVQKLHASKVPTDISTSQKIETTFMPEPVRENIAFEDFTKLDLRVGTILNAVPVLKSKKLLMLTIDLGFEQRTVVSGIAESFSPDQVIGKQVTLVANLAPREIMGIASQGMVLMGEAANGKLVFISPSDIVPNGSIAR